MTLPPIDERDLAGLRARPLAPLSPGLAVDLKGLTSVEADRRRAAKGGNTLPDVGDRPLARAIEKFWSPVPWMLEAAIVLELALGKYDEGAVIGLLLVSCEHRARSAEIEARDMGTLVIGTGGESEQIGRPVLGPSRISPTHRGYRGAT